MNDLKPTTFFDLAAFQHAALFEGVDYVWDALKQLEDYFKKLKLGVLEGDVHPGAILVDAHLISIGKGSVVEPGAYIKGPCFIGKDSVVRHGAYLRGNVLVGNKCVIGNSTEIKNSILLNGAHAPHLSYVGDSILGARVNLGAGTICSNYRFDKQEIFISHQGKRIATGLRKLGAIMGDDAQTGCNAVTNPGTLFGKNASCWPGVNVGGVIPPDTSVQTTKVRNDLYKVAEKPFTQ